MPVIQVNDQQYALHQGPTRVGTGAEADVRIPGDESLGIQAIVEMAADDSVVIRRANVAAKVKVNGVPLGIEPTPLIHGDKVDVAGTELLFSDDRKGGATAYVSSLDVPELAHKRSGPARATAATGGRLVSLVDGKEYAIPASGIVIGRDASSDVVVAQSEVSRRHAGILPSEKGYLLQDYSTNGVYVNGVRITEAQLLSRADVLRIGSEEFRFYADVAPEVGAGAPRAAPMNGAAPKAATPVATAEVAPATAAPPRSPAEAASASAAAAPAAGAQTGGSAAAPASSATPARRPVPEPPTAPLPDARPVLATLEVMNEGVSRGKIYDIRVPLAHVGRGAHNEVVIAEDSVSDTHALLQRRDDGWYVADLGSTNGTYVGGVRLTGERRLEGAPDVRFGGVKLVFRPRSDAAPADAGAKGTRAIATNVREARNPAARGRPTVASSVPDEQPAGGVPVWVWIAAAAVVIAGILYALKA